MSGVFLELIILHSWVLPKPRQLWVWFIMKTTTDTLLCFSTLTEPTGMCGMDVGHMMVLICYTGIGVGNSWPISWKKNEGTATCLIIKVLKWAAIGGEILCISGFWTQVQINKGCVRKKIWSKRKKSVTKCSKNPQNYFHYSAHSECKILVLKRPLTIFFT